MRDFGTLLKRLGPSAEKELRLLVLPDWWSPEAEADPGVLPEMEILVARYLGCELKRVRDDEGPLPSRQRPAVCFYCEESLRGKTVFYFGTEVHDHCGKKLEEPDD